MIVHIRNDSYFISHLYCKQMWIYTECSYTVLIHHDDAFSTGAIKAWHTEEVVHSNGQMITWCLLFHQYVGAVFQEIKGYALERYVVGVPVKFTAT